jgi:H+/Cl- antiporter ClcA
MVNANNPSHYKVIILGIFVGLFGIFIKQFIHHSMVVDLIGWAITFIGAAITISGVLKVLKD